MEPNVHVKDDVVVKGDGLENYRVFAPDSGKDTFSQWNTKPDGSGESCYPAALLTLFAGVTILYAQWCAKTQTDNFKE